MTNHDEAKWLCENARNLEKFAGKWVLFSIQEGLVCNGASLQSVLKAARESRKHRQPFVFHVPSKEELRSPLPLVKKKP